MNLEYTIQLGIFGFSVAQLVKNPLAMQETLVQFLSWKDPLEKGQATHSSDFYKLILGPTSFLNSEVLTDFFLNSSLFSIYNVISYANRESFTYFPIWKSFISFCCSIELARTPRTTLNRSGKKRYPLFPDFKMKLYSQVSFQLQVRQLSFIKLINFLSILS